MLSDRIAKLYLEDFRKGADRLHELLDGKVCVSEKIAVLLVGFLSAVVPSGIMIAIFILKGGSL